LANAEIDTSTTEAGSLVRARGRDWVALPSFSLKPRAHLIQAREVVTGRHVPLFCHALL
jgi:hypothetical protein